MSEARIIRRLVQRKLEKVKRSSTMIRRYMTIPEAVPLYEVDGVTQARDKETDKPFITSFEKFIEGRTTDSAYVSDTPRDQNTVQWTMAMIVSGESVRAAFRGKNVGDIVGIDDDDWQRLKRSTEKGAYHVVAAASLIGFMRIITDAKTDKPKDHVEDDSSLPDESGALQGDPAAAARAARRQRAK